MSDTPFPDTIHVTPEIILCVTGVPQIRDRLLYLVRVFIGYSPDLFTILSSLFKRLPQKPLRKVFYRITRRGISYVKCVCLLVSSLKECLLLHTVVKS